VWIGYWCVLFVLTHMPVPGSVPAPIPNADKAYHFILFFLLTWLGGRHVLCLRRRALVTTFLVWGVVYSCYAALDEWTQPVFGRNASFGDWVCDVTGIVAATVVLVLRRRRTSISSSAGPSA
jgi:VanZ family protein